MRFPRLRLHLSTCIVLMFAAGFLAWLNLRDYPAIQEHDGRVEATGFQGGLGWPVRWYSLRRPGARELSQNAVSTNVHGTVLLWAEETSAGPMVIIIDIAVALLILAVVAVVCERLLLRYTLPRKPSHLDTH